MSHVSKPRCDGCRYYEKHDVSVPDEGESLGFCYRFPPVLNHAMLRETGNAFTNAEAGSFWSRPVVYGYDFCGEFVNGTNASSPIDNA